MLEAIAIAPQERRSKLHSYIAEIEAWAVHERLRVSSRQVKVKRYDAALEHALLALKEGEPHPAPITLHKLCAFSFIDVRTTVTMSALN